MRAKWGVVGTRKYNSGVDRGMLYPFDATTSSYPKGVAWPGLTEVAASPTGAEPTPIYADNIKYLNLISNEEFGATISALMSPPEFDECDGQKEILPGFIAGQQTRKTFGFSWRTFVNNDTGAIENIIHIMYGGSAAPAEKTHSTINESPTAEAMSWEVTTIPVDNGEEGFRPTAYYKIHLDSFSEAQVKALEDALYGTDPASEGAEGTEPKLPMPAELKAILSTQG